tara:strand:- start:6992 stop:7555 length:564 start_codon:yes stop_codon:yes gene_type:complete
VNSEDNVIEHFRDYFNLFDKVDTHFWIAGGALRDLFLNKQFNDIDFFFTSKSDAIIARDQLLKKGFNRMESTKAHWRVCRDDITFDLCHSWSSPQETIDKFDYSVNAVALDNNLKFYYNGNFLKDLKNKNLTKIHRTDRWVGQEMGRLKKLLIAGYNIDTQNLIMFLDDMEATRQYRVQLRKDKDVK